MIFPEKRISKNEKLLRRILTIVRDLARSSQLKRRAWPPHLKNCSSGSAVLENMESSLHVYLFMDWQLGDLQGSFDIKCAVLRQQTTIDKMCSLGRLYILG